MSIKYELSLWREYPGVNAIQEEKVCIIAATGMDNAGRAQDIKLVREHNGKQTLTFTIPAKYFDIFEGKDLKNPFIEQVIDHSKLKLWRDELWWNPFAINKGIDEETGCTLFEGQFVQGRWYEFIVTQRSQKRSKKQLLYTYTCNSLFMNELSRTGYNLEFVPDTDIMKANGMGTAHTLAERIVDGTDWQYVKTEVFPDYKEEYNAVTGETVKVPVSTDQIEFASGLDRYVYCYTLKIDDIDRQEAIINEIHKAANKEGLSLINGTNGDFWIDNNIFYWRPKRTDIGKDYIYGYTKTDIITSYADKVLCYTSGLINSGTSTNEEGETIENKVEEATLLSSATLWESLNIASVDSVMITEDDEKSEVYYYLQVKYNGAEDSEPLVYNSGYSDKSLEKGQLLMVNLLGGFGTETSPFMLSGPIDLYIYDGNPEQSNIYTKYTLTLNSGLNCFKDSYIITIPQYIENPYFCIGAPTHYYSQISLQGMFIYKFVGATEEIDTAVKNWNALQLSNCTKISNLGLIQNSSFIPEGITDLDLNANTCKIDGVDSNFWLPVGTMAQNDFKNGIDVYCIEFNYNGRYVNIPIIANEDEVTKISSFNTDKRRAISGSKSNRYSLLETVSQTFFCFTRFLVEHDSNGYIKTDSAGRPLKYFTFVSELGRRNFNGFNYGVNLEAIERKVDSAALVTKVYIESIDNQYDDSGVISIQNSDYNKLGEPFFYNFSYFARQGFFNNSSFLEDYAILENDVGLLNAQAKEKNEKYIAKKQYEDIKRTSYDTHVVTLSSTTKTANDELNNLKWERFISHAKSYFTSVDDAKINSITTFPNIDFKEIASISELQKFNKANGYTMASYYGNIAFYMDNQRYDTGTYDGAEAWVGNGDQENNIESSLIALGVAQTRYKNLNSTIEKEKIELEEATEQTKTLLEEYNNLVETKNNKIALFENKYKRFILEGTWSGNDYIDPDVYYIDATRAMATSCMPKVSYSMNVIDLSKVANPYNPEETDWGKDFTFDIGDTTYVKDTELFGNIEQKAMIASITSHIDSNKPDDLTLRNFETRFEELFQSIAAAVTTLQLNENIYSRAANFTADGMIDTTILQKTFMDNKNLVISSANNKVTQDNLGITIKTSDDSGQLLRAIAGGIFLSKDNGKTFTAGLTADGFNASLITTGQIDTSKIVIRSNETPQYVLDTLGLTAYSTAASKSNVLVRDNIFTRFDQFGIYMTDKGRLFNKNWWKGLDETRLVSHVTTKEINLYGTRSMDLMIREEGAFDADSQSIWNEIWYEYDDNWDRACYLGEDVISIEQVYYYTLSEYYDGEYYTYGLPYYWSPSDFIGPQSSYQIERELFKTSRGYYIVFKNVDAVKELLPSSTIGYDEFWTGDFKVRYVDKQIEQSGTTAEDYIIDNSIFSLTRKGLVINSSGGSSTIGHIKISTENPEVGCYDADNNIRVKVGYIRTEEDTKKEIYGIDIYQGAIRLYGCNYNPTLKDEDASIYFKNDNMYINGEIIRKFSRLVPETAITATTITRLGYNEPERDFLDWKFSRNGINFTLGYSNNSLSDSLFIGNMIENEKFESEFISCPNAIISQTNQSSQGLLISAMGYAESTGTSLGSPKLRLEAKYGTYFTPIYTTPGIELHESENSGSIALGFYLGPNSLKVETKKQSDGSYKTSIQLNGDVYISNQSLKDYVTNLIKANV